MELKEDFLRETIFEKVKQSKQLFKYDCEHFCRERMKFTKGEPNNWNSAWWMERIQDVLKNQRDEKVKAQTKQMIENNMRNKSDPASVAAAPGRPKKEGKNKDRQPRGRSRGGKDKNKNKNKKKEGAVSPAPGAPKKGAKAKAKGKGGSRTPRRSQSGSGRGTPRRKSPGSERNTPRGRSPSRRNPNDKSDAQLKKEHCAAHQKGLWGDGPGCRFGQNCKRKHGDKVSKTEYEKITAMAEKAASKSKERRRSQGSNGSRGSRGKGGKAKGKGGDRTHFTASDGTKIPICCKDFRTSGSCPAGNVDRCAKGRHLTQAQFEAEKKKLNS